MTEKRKTLLIGVVMIIVQGIVAWAVWISTWCMARLWLEGFGYLILPPLTGIAMRYGQVIPITATILAVIVVMVGLRRGRASTQWYLSLAIAEIIALALFAVALTMPALSTTYAFSGTYPAPAQTEDEKKLAQLKVGMPQQQVERLLGPPAKLESKGTDVAAVATYYLELSTNYPGVLTNGTCLITVIYDGQYHGLTFMRVEGPHYPD